jgi:acyl-CoA oxidase
MLMTHSQLARDSTFTKDPLRARLSYSVMMLVRGRIPGIFTVELSQALKIATRHSVVQQQGLGPADALKDKASIFQCKHQHFRLLSMIAKTYAMFFGSRVCDEQYIKLREMQNENDHSLALCSRTDYWHEGMRHIRGYRWCRRRAQAVWWSRLYGYLRSTDIVGALSDGATFEGGNYVLWQQVGRHVLKQLDRLQDGEPIEPQLQYLTNVEDPNIPCSAFAMQFLDPQVQFAIYLDRVHRQLVKAHSAIRASTRLPGDAWNEHMMLLISTSQAHIEYFILKSFIDTISALRDTALSSLRTVLNRIRFLFAPFTIINSRTVDALSMVETADAHSL